MIEEVAQHHAPGGLEIETTASFAHDVSFWKTNPPDAAVFYLPEDDILQNFFFAKLKKDVPADQPVLFLCNSISANLMQTSMGFSKVRMQKMPADSFALYRAVLDLVRDYEPGQQQVHPRYLTDQEVEVLSDYHEGKIRGKMRNLSLSGAYFESGHRDFEVRPGDLVKLSVQLGKPSKQYVFDAKVVWSKAHTQVGTMGYGVAFIDKEEVYNNLLKNI